MSTRGQIKEAWIVGCGACGYDTILKTDLSIELRVPEKPWCPVAPEPCADCRRTQETGDEHYNEGNLYEEAVTHLMGWCGCGAPESVTELIFSHLRLLEERSGRRDEFQAENYGTAFEDWMARLKANAGGDAQLYLVGYVADALDWTEHGGAVGGGEWTSDAGKAALARWEAHVGSVV